MVIKYTKFDYQYPLSVVALYIYVYIGLHVMGYYWRVCVVGIMCDLPVTTVYTGRFMSLIMYMYLCVCRCMYMCVA